MTRQQLKPPNLKIHPGLLQKPLIPVGYYVVVPPSVLIKISATFLFFVQCKCPRFVEYQFVNGRVSNQGSAGGVLLLADAGAETSGAKATACGRLASLAAASDKGSCVGQYFYLFFACKVFCFCSFAVRMCYL